MCASASKALPLVTVVVVNLNGRDHLETLAASLADQSYPADRIEVIVVDNGSTDDSVAWLRARVPDYVLIRNDQNLGFARPNNQAAALAQGEFLALVNNDMKLSPDWLSTMVRALAEGPEDVAAVASRIVNWDGTTIDYMGGTMAFNGMGFQPGYGTPVSRVEPSRYPDELLFACGGAMLIRREVFLEAGGFDEDYFAYYEDVDLGWRLWVLGHRIRFIPGAVVQHRHNSTSKRFDAYRKVVLMERNALCSVLKNYEEAHLASAWPAAMLLALKRIAVRSGIEREAFRFGPQTQAKPVVVRPEGRWRWALGRAQELGVTGSLKRAAVAVARRVLERWSGPVPGAEGHESITREAYAGLVGLEDFIDLLPKMLAKRQQIQAKRRRSDAELFRMFGDPLTPVEGRGSYHEAHATVTRELGLATLFGGPA